MSKTMGIETSEFFKRFERTEPSGMPGVSVRVATEGGEDNSSETRVFFEFTDQLPNISVNGETVTDDQNTESLEIQIYGTWERNSLIDAFRKAADLLERD